MGRKIERKQVNVRLEPELYDFIIEYSIKNYKSVTGMLREMIADLYRKSKPESETK